MSPLLIAAFRAETGGVEGDATEWAAAKREIALELLGGDIGTAGEGKTDDVQFVNDIRKIKDI